MSDTTNETTTPAPETAPVDAAEKAKRERASYPIRVLPPNQHTHLQAAHDGKLLMRC